MSNSEFRWNKKRKHYAYIFKKLGEKRFNILITSKPFVIKKDTKLFNVKLFHHPNPNKDGVFYLIQRVFLDDLSSFDTKNYNKWFFNKNDKRKVKRIKKRKFNK